MRTVMVIPRRGGDEFRDKNFEVIYNEFQTYGYEIFIADSGDEPFSVAKSFNKGAEEAGDWDKIILCEADGWVAADQMHAAVESDHPGMTFTFNHWIKLSASGTKAFWKGKRNEFPEGMLRKKQHPIPPAPGAGPRVVPRELWDKVNGFDERFIGWGPEDQDFAFRCERIHPHDRIEGKAYDLWHPVAPRDKLEANRAVFRENRNS